MSSFKFDFIGDYFKYRDLCTPVGVGVLITGVSHVVLLLNVGSEDLPVEARVFHLDLVK